MRYFLSLTRFNFFCGIFLAGLLFSGCAKNVLPTPEIPTRVVQKMPDITYHPRTNEHTTTLKVLAYNVEGMPFPIKSGRGQYLKKIGKKLAKMRENGTEPDIVLLQEGFMDTTLDLINTAGYHNVVSGPKRGERGAKLKNARAKAYQLGKHFFKGEGWGKLYHSGLYILSNFPITSRYVRGFKYCAGWDCLANKGVMAAEVRLPGLPTPIMIGNIHMQAGGAADVPRARSTQAYKLQVDETRKFFRSLPLNGNPFIFGGDFNIRNKESRLLHGLKTMRVEQPNMLTRYYCTKVNLTCDIDMTLESDEAPWRYTQDLQGFIHGKDMKISAVRLQTVFDGTNKQNPKLSDHNGYMVTYELRW